MSKLPRSIFQAAEAEVARHPEALISVLSPLGVFEYISPSTEQMLGFKRDYALGHSVSEYYRPAEVSHIMLTIQDALLSGESVPTTRNTPLQTGGTRRMRGSYRKLVASEDGQEYVLSVAWPAEKL